MGLAIVAWTREETNGDERPARSIIAAFLGRRDLDCCIGPGFRPTRRNLVLEHLRHIRSAVAGLGADLRDLNSCVGRPQPNVAQIQVASAEHSVRFGRLDARVAPIERRLELADA